MTPDMATPRLPFLYPNLLRAIRSCEPTTYRSFRPATQPKSRRKSKQANFHSAARRSQDTQHQRYGPAVGEIALPPPGKPSDIVYSPKSPITRDASKATSKSQGTKATAESQIDSKTDAAERREEEPRYRSPQIDAEAIKAGEEKGEAPPQGASSPTPLDRILNMPPPPAVSEEGHKHPHLTTPPYVHHFDTYSRVKDLGKGTYTDEQSITLMKAIRSLLGQNLDVAKESLVSKSDVENELYLFRAACSELRTSLQTSRQSEIQRQRTQRAHLQHEADILNQRMSQEMLGLKEELKGMFNDRKMATGEEKQKLDSKIQELNYEITVLLNSDSKSEVEGLRWVLTRRAAMAIAISAGQYYQYLQSHATQPLTLVQS